VDDGSAWQSARKIADARRWFGKGFSTLVHLPSGQKMIPPTYQNAASARIPGVSLYAGLVRVLAGSYPGFDGPVDDTAIEPESYDTHLDQNGYFGHTIDSYWQNGVNLWL